MTEERSEEQGSGLSRLPGTPPGDPVPVEASPTKAPPPRGLAAYLGVGCLTGAAGLAGGGMLAVLVAKVVGAATRCAPTAENGAPCNWDMYWTWGARIGLILLPTIVLWRMWRSDRNQHSARNSQ